MTKTDRKAGAGSIGFPRTLHAGRAELGLPDTLGFGMSEAMAIFLDLRSDRYFSFELEPGHPGLGIISAMLRQEGLLVPGGRPVEPTLKPLAPRQFDVFESQASRSGKMGDVAEVAARLCRVRRGLRRGQLHLLVRLSTAMARLADRTAPAAPLAARFHACRRLIPIRRNCLMDSLALLQFLGKRGVGARLVFGAKLDPFAAHCWVEHDDVLLNKSRDVAEQFVPVLVAG